VAENSAGAEYSYSTLLYIVVRRVPPNFAILHDELYEVIRGADLEVTCVAVGSPMPHVKWRKGSQDITDDFETKIGRNVLHLKDIQDSANYTCVDVSKLGIIEASTEVRVRKGLCLKQICCFYGKNEPFF
jgi:receptor-type tyrosine-protein phosphatase F